MSAQRSKLLIMSFWWIGGLLATLMDTNLTSNQLMFHPSTPIPNWFILMSEVRLIHRQRDAMCVTVLHRPLAGLVSSQLNGIRPLFLAHRWNRCYGMQANWSGLATPEQLAWG